MKSLIIIFLTIISITGMYFVNSANNISTESSDSKIQKLEEFLVKNNANPQIAEAYRFALENPKGVLSKVKCYCGCIQNNNHKHNMHCFFHDDGSIDSMGLNCGLCVKTALISKQMLAEGKSIEEISNYVDNRWGKEKI